MIALLRVDTRRNGRPFHKTLSHVGQSFVVLDWKINLPRGGNFTRSQFQDRPFTVSNRSQELLVCVGSRGRVIPVLASQDPLLKCWSSAQQHEPKQGKHARFPLRIPRTGTPDDDTPNDGQQHDRQWRQKNLVEPRHDDSSRNQSAPQIERRNHAIAINQQAYQRSHCGKHNNQLRHWGKLETDDDAVIPPSNQYAEKDTCGHRDRIAENFGREPRVRPAHVGHAANRQFSLPNGLLAPGRSTEMP